tara:strand:+ start:5650 stop:6174 length:525 start_codon:yes stop_codon:yes gene_type:complete
MTFASYLSLLRALMIIPIILLHGHHLIVFLLFLLAAITDWLDGYIARKTKTETNTGALLDLLADKILVSLSLIWIIFLYQDLYIFFPSLIIISRELIISSVRQYIVEKSEGTRIEVSFIGKSKTTLQLIAISMLFLVPLFEEKFYLLTISILWLSSFISIFSLYTYLLKWKSSL